MTKSKQSFQWNKVTPLSKYLAMVLFVTLPIFCFVVGLKLNLNKLYSINSWDSFIIKEMKISIPYPSSWKISKITTWDGKATNSGMSYGVTMTDPKGEIRIVWGDGEYGGGCDEKNQEEHIILGKKTLTCHVVDNEGDTISFYLPKSDNWWGQVMVTLMPEYKDSANFFQQFLSLITYVNK